MDVHKSPGSFFLGNCSASLLIVLTGLFASVFGSSLVLLPSDFCLTLSWIGLPDLD